MVVVPPQPFVAEQFAEHGAFRLQILNRLHLLSIVPPGHGNYQETNRRQAVHEFITKGSGTDAARFSLILILMVSTWMVDYNSRSGPAHRCEG